MPRSVASTRSAASARTAASTRTAVGAYRLPYELIDLGVTHYWDFRTAKLGTNSSTVADLIGMRSAQLRGSSGTAVYPTATYSADLERTNADFFTTGPYSFGSSVTAITYFAWIKRESIGAIHHILADWETSGNQRGSRVYLTSDLFQMSISSNGTNNTDYTSTETLTDTSSWHFVVYSYDTTNRCVITLDNTNLTVSRTTGSDPATINSSNVAKLIGANLPSVPANYWDGLIGICGVCVGKALSTSEKATLYNLTNRLGSYV